MTLNIAPATLRDWLRDGQELAVLDLRDEADFAKGEPLYAANVPAARLLDDIGRFVPRQAVRTVLVDAQGSEAAGLAAQLSRRGWPHVHALEGGLQAWLALPSDDGSPLPTFDTSGRRFSLAVREQRQTPVVSAAQLQRQAEAGANVAVLDTRTLAEYVRQHVPGAIAVPAAELLLRFGDLVPDPATQVVVSCAGLPRAILGAQTLIDAGVPNAVAYLDEGTAGWSQAGLALERGASRLFGPPSPRAQEIAQRLARQLGGAGQPVPQIDLATARAWQADGERTTYLLDVRTPAEFEAGHLPATLSSEGGQLVAVSHRTIAVRGARVVLIDDALGARAQVVAHWLGQRGHGYEIAILRHDFAAAQPAAATPAALAAA